MSTSGGNPDLKAQYGTSSNLDARRYLHERFNTNKNSWVPWLFDHFDLPPRCSILEVGCGTGYVWEGNRDRVPSGWLVTLTDLSPGMLAAAAKRLSCLNWPPAFAVADIQALPFDDASFDCVMAHHMLYHVPDVDRGLAEVIRVLRPGGRFYAATNGQDHLKELHNAVNAVAPDMPYGQQSIIAAFCLENGSAILARHFSDVKRHDFRDALEVTEVEAIVNYVKSVISAEQYLTPDRIDRLRRIVADAIARDGAFRVRRASGGLLGGQEIVAMPAPVNLDSTMALLKSELDGVFGRRLVSIILYGSAVFDDLAPGYGDLDFLAVIDGDLCSDDCLRLVEVRKRLRDGPRGILAHMLEGAFLPRPMLDPAVHGSAFWWGTSGERPWSANQLGALALHVIRERGRVTYGADIRAEIPPQSDEVLMADVRGFCETARLHGEAGRLHSIDWLLTSARLLLWLEGRRLSSKSEAADWAFDHAKGAWRMELPKAKHLRLSPSCCDEPDWRTWLNSLASPIQEAREEVERELHTPRRLQ